MANGSRGLTIAPLAFSSALRVPTHRLPMRAAPRWRMKNLRKSLASVALVALMSWGSVATGQVSLDVTLPGVSIGINLPLYPQLVQVPNYPVYYAPQVQGNYFFYDGSYWVYQGDNWYASSWYDGPWSQVGPQSVPLYVLRIPVRYYRSPPSHFRGWQRDAPPRWGEHWGNDWAQQHRGWDQWDRRAMPRPAPLPVYQRQHGGDRYPRVDEQRELQRRYYRHEPRDEVSPRAPPQAQAPRPGPGQANDPDRGQGRARDNDREQGRDKDRGKQRERDRDDSNEHGKDRKK